MLEEDKKEAELIVPPFQDANSWVKYAESDNKEMDEGLKAALESIAAASAATGERTAEAVREFQETGKESARGIQQAIADFFKTIGQSFASMYEGVTRAFNDLGDKIVKVFARDDRSQEEKTAAAVDAERVTKARDAFKQAMQEVKTAFETGVKEAEEGANKELVDTAAVEKADSISKVRTALSGLKNLALGAVDKAEAAVRGAVAKMHEGFAGYGKEVREASQVLDEQEQQVVDGALEGLSETVRTEAYVFNHSVTQALGAARSKAKDLVQKAIDLVTKRESTDVGRIREGIKSSADTVQQAFESFFTGMTDRLTSLSSTFGNCADTAVNGILGKEELEQEVRDNLRALASSAKTESQAAVIKGCGTAVVARGAVRDEVRKLHEAVDDLKDIESLGTVRDILEGFKESTAQIARSAMDEIKVARGAIQAQADNFAAEVGKHGASAGLEEVPQKELHKYLDKLQKEMKRHTEVSIKEELGRVKAVIKQADKAMQRTIADIPYKALAVVPYRDVCAKIGQALTGGWGARWNEAVVAAAQATQGAIVERIAGAGTKLVVAFYGFVDSIQRSHEEIVEAFRGFFKFVEQSFKSVVKSVSDRISNMKAEATPEEQKALENLQRRVNDSAALVDTALQEVRQQIDQALNTASQEVRNVQDLSSAQNVLGILEKFQASATVAAGEALKTVEAQVKNIEQEFEQREFDRALEAEYHASSQRMEAQRKAEQERAAEQKKFNEALEREYNAYQDRLKAELNKFRDGVSTELEAVGGVVQEAEKVVLAAVEAAIGEVQEVGAPEIVPLAGLDQWVDEAQVVSATMDSALESALDSIVEASSETEEKTAEAVNELQKSAQESVKGIKEAIATLCSAVGTSLAGMCEGIARSTSAFGTKITDAFSRNRQQQKTVDAEVLESALQAYTQALTEQRQGFDTAVRTAEGQIEQGVQSTTQQLNEADNIANVRNVLEGMQSTAMGAIHDVETAVETAAAGVQKGLRGYVEAVEGHATEVLTESGRQEVDAVLEDLSKQVQEGVKKFQDLAKPALEEARTSVMGRIVQRTMQIISERESAEVAGVQENVMAAAGSIQLAFNNFFGTALKQLTDHAAEIHGRIDDMVKDNISYRVSLDAEQVMHDTTAKVHEGIDGVVESVFQHIRVVADSRMRNAMNDLQSHVNFLQGVHELESVRDMLRSFQGSTVKIMGDVLKQISEGRAAIVDEVAKFQDQARNVGQGLDVSPRKDLENALDKFQKDLVEAQQGTAAMEKDLEQVRTVVRRADREMSQTIRSMPYKALAAVPYMGVGKMLEDALKNAGKEGWVAP
ncbi:MAG: hypothetical protein ACTJLL_04820, partial [Anaplasma sp.]